MGDPKKLRKKYSTPVHPWNKAEIDRAKGLRREYGLNIRKEILIADSFLKKYKDIAKRLIADSSKQGTLEKKQMMDKLGRLGLLSAEAELDEVLSLSIGDVLNRRIQSVVYRKGLARSMKQARQFIVHRHITLDGKDITSPSYLLSVEEESKLRFKNKSALSDENHPERFQEVVSEEVKEITPKEEKESKPAYEKPKVEETKKEKKATPKKEKKAEPAKKEEIKEETLAEKEVKEEEVKPAEKEEQSNKVTGSSAKPVEPKKEEKTPEEVKPTEKKEETKE